MSLATTGFHVASPPTTGGVRLNQVLCSTFQVAPSSSSSARSIQKNPGDDDVAPAPAPVSAASTNNSNSRLMQFLSGQKYENKNKVVNIDFGSATPMEMQRSPNSSTISKSVP